MKKFNKIMTVLVLVAAVFAFVAPVFATSGSVSKGSVSNSSVFGENIVPNTANSGSVGTVDTAVGKVWNTVKLILQILAIAAVVFAGVRYMFASADQKADIKKSMGILAIGGALVFGATWIIQFIITVTGQITGEM